MKYIRGIISELFTKTFITFVIIGSINTIASAVLAAIYSLVLDDITAYVVGYITTICLAYTLNTYFTFKERWQLINLYKYAISVIPNFLIQWITVYVGVSILHINNYICYGIAAIIGVPVTFIILKAFVFIKKKSTS